MNQPVVIINGEEEHQVVGTTLGDLRLSFPACHLTTVENNRELVIRASSYVLGNQVYNLHIPASTSSGSPNVMDYIATKVTRVDTKVTRVAEIVPMVCKIVPIVCQLTIDANNLWTKTQIAESTTDRDELFRRNVLEHLGYHKPRRSKVRQRFTCMVTGEDGNGDEVVVGHIAPAKSSIRRLAKIGMVADDVSNVRNGLLLAKGIEVAFDLLRLSFVKTNPLSQDLYMQIWDDRCRSIPIYEGSQRTIGEFDGHVLNLGTHQPFRRALSFHAYQAYLLFKEVTELQEPSEFGSVEDTEHFKEREMMKDAVLRDINEELQEDI